MAGTLDQESWALSLFSSLPLTQVMCNIPTRPVGTQCSPQKQRAGWTICDQLSIQKEKGEKDTSNVQQMCQRVNYLGSGDENNST